MSEKFEEWMKRFLCNLVVIFMPLQGLLSEQPLQPEAYFSPNPDFFSPLLSLLQQEKELIQIATPRLTDRQIWRALMQAGKRGVSVEIILDTKTLAVGKLLQKLPHGGSRVWVHSESRKEKNRTIMNHKFCICKSQGAVWNASCSFSPNAKRHCEHALVIRQSGLVDQFTQEFEKLKQTSILLEKNPVNN